MIDRPPLAEGVRERNLARVLQVVHVQGPVSRSALTEVDALTIAAVGLDRGIRVRERIEQDDLITPERTASLITERIERWRSGPLAEANIVGVGLAVPGLVRASDGLVRIAPHLEWNEVSVRDLVSDASGLPATVGNDADLGIIAEHLYGAARGHDNVVYLNGGASGIGGAGLVHGPPLGGSGGEPREVRP